jgi:hypothetical protein
MIFVKENRSKVAAANPKASVTELGKILGAEWRNLSQQAKKVRFVRWFVPTLKIQKGVC